MKTNMLRKPKTLLIFPPSTVYKGDPTVPAKSPPLGLAYIAAYLEKFGYPVEIIDSIAEGDAPKENKQCTYYGLSSKQIASRIKKLNPDIVGIACMYTAYAGDAHRVAEIAKKVCPKTMVVFGGAHATIFPELTLRDKNVDIVVLGEGEVTILEIVQALEKKKSPFGLNGTVVREKGTIKKNRPRAFVEDLDAIPFPARHLLPMDKYLKVEEGDFLMRTPAMAMITSRGCPGRCIYCSIHSVWGHTWRGRSPKSVVDEMEELFRKYGIKEIYFFDDSMGVDKKRLEAICNEIILRKLDIKWSPPNGIAHWTLDESLLEKMKKAGCYRLTFGIESGNPETRRFIGKPYDLTQAKRMIKYANKIGMWTICTNIIGFPHETKEQIRDTINFAVDSDTDLAIFYLLCPHPGTKVYEIFKSEGLANYDYIFTPRKDLKTEDFAQIGRALAGRGVATKYFSQDQLQTIVSKAYKDFLFRRFFGFLNPLRIIRKIRSFEDFFYVSRVGISSIKMAFRNITHKAFDSQMLRREVD